MRIALISRRFDPSGGGTERDLIVTARILAQAGHLVTIYAAEIRRPAGEFSLRRIRSPMLGRTLGLLAFAVSAVRRARRDGSDIVISFARVPGADVLRSGGGAHSSYVKASRQWLSPFASAAMRLNPYHRAQIFTERLAFRSRLLQKAVAVSRKVRDDIVAAFALDPAKVITLYNGVDLERFHPKLRLQSRDAMRRELALPDRAPVVVFVGNGFARKGLRFLLQAWTALNDHSSLVIAGVDQAAGRYARLAQRLGLADRVRFIGARESIEQVFAMADALALPSLFEPFGNVILEAMAAGLPVLCSAACGAAELIPAQLHEFIVRDPTDSGELARRLSGLIAMTRDGDDQLRLLARGAVEHLTWDSYAAKLLELIASL